MAPGTPAKPHPGATRVGRDRVVQEGDRLIVDAACEMPDWRVRRFRRIAILYSGSRWALTGHEPGAHGRHVYQLELWPDDRTELPGAVIPYDEDQVRIRDRVRKAGAAASVLATLSIPCIPLIGFLPSHVKTALHGVIGVHPLVATRASLTLETIAAVVLGALNIIHIATNGALTPELDHSFWAAILLLLDAGMRFGSVVEGDLEQPGFFEWAFPKKLWGNRGRESRRG